MDAARARPGRWVLAVCALGTVIAPRSAAEEQTPWYGIPRNAMADPTLEGYPHVGRAQCRALLGEIAGASVGQAVRQPIRSTLDLGKRLSEQALGRARSLATRLSLMEDASTGAFDPPADGRLDAPLGSTPLPAALTLLPTSQAAVDGLLALLGRATQAVDFMIYGWEDDPTGRAVAAALEGAARRGVRIRVLVDRGGFLIHNAAAAEGLPTFLDRLRAAPGVAVIEPPNPRIRFDHRKLAVVDGRTAWSGGMILTEVARTRWENLAFLAEGPVVGQYAAVFEERWRACGGAPGGPPDCAGLCLPDGRANATVRMVRTEPNERSLKDAVYHAIDHARHHVYVENCYFSDTLLAEKLIAARRRGVDARVVLTLRGNVARMNHYLALQANRLRRGGVRVYLAPGMTHIKTMTADGVWSYVGTGNFDDLSLRNNREVGLTVMSPSCAATLETAVLLPHMAQAEELHAPLPLPPNWLLLELSGQWL